MLGFRDFPKWLKAWRQIESTTRRAYHVTELLTETRLGELARLRWADVKHNEPNLVVGKAKAGQDIAIPVSNEIAVALQMARDDAAQLSVGVAPGRTREVSRGRSRRNEFRGRPDGRALGRGDLEPAMRPNIQVTGFCSDEKG
jgi:integrase